MVSAFLNLDIPPEPVDTTEIAFGEWLPDAPEKDNPGAVEALNVIPAEGGYVPFKEHMPDGANGVVPEAVRGATAVVAPNDVVQLYAGSLSGVYTRYGGNFTSIFTGPSSQDNAWKFIRVNEQMVMIHPEYLPMRSPVSSTTPAVVLGGSPPIAACGAQVGDFLMLGNLLSDPDDGGGAFPSRVRWGGFNNVDSPWISDPATQADFQDLPAEGGPVVGIMGREVATIYQARMISRASYRGPPAIWDIVTVEDKRGLIARDAVVDIGPFQIFPAEDGFFIWNGTNATPIGDAKVNRYFFNKLAYAVRSRMVGAVDFINGCVMWAFPTDSSGALSEILIYSYRENKWAHSIQTLEYLFSSASSNISIEDLIDPLESYGESFDSAAYRLGGRTSLAAFNTAHTYGLFTGQNMAATIDTGEFSGPQGRRVFVNGTRPNIDLTVPVATVQVAKRDQMIGQPVLFSSFPTAQEIDGVCPIIEDARYMRFRTMLPLGANWNHAMGIDVMRKAGGQF